VQQYLNKGLRATGTESATYAAMVDHADESVGRLLKKLKEHQITDRTVVIFMSDNGGRIPQTSNAPLSGSKGELLEGGIRVPMLIKWPRVIKPGTVCRVPVTSTDFYPTLLDMAGLLLKPNQHMDGKSLVPLCKGKTCIEREAIFWHYPHYNGQPKGKPSSAVRKGNWKLIEFFEDNHLELYNLKQDIGEKNNLIHKHPEKANELYQRLENWRKKVNAQMPKPNPNYDPNQESGWPKERIRSMPKPKK
jgi:arylsulfatase A-like enzyme